MHYFGILAILLTLTFATGGHSQTFSKAAEAVSKGEVSDAIDLFSTALRRTIQDADVAQRKADAAPAAPVEVRQARAMMVR